MAKIMLTSMEKSKYLSSLAFRSLPKHIVDRAVTHESERKKVESRGSLERDYQNESYKPLP